jgi:hypothetical protein
MTTPTAPITNNSADNSDSTPQQYESLKFDPDYEISTTYPYPIRKISKPNRNIREHTGSTGYSSLTIGSKYVRKHHLIVLQWLPNPNNYTAIDHMNRNPKDNHIDNLIWCTNSENSKNRVGHKGNIKYEYVDELPANTVPINRVKDWIFNILYYNPDEQAFYIKVRNQYRKLHVLGTPTARYVAAPDITNKPRSICFNTFFKDHTF